MLKLFDIKDILDDVKYKNWRLIFGLNDHANLRPYMQWEFDAPCAKTGATYKQKGRKWYLSQHMTESELVFTAFKAALTAEEHECREFFTYQRKRVMNPHISVQALLSVCNQEDVREDARP